MPKSLVIDTNVLVHASNDNYPKQIHCINLIESLMNSNDLIYVDDNADSYILYEYDKHLDLGMLGYTLLLLLREADRLKFVTRTVPAPINRKINKTGIKTGDRIFVKIAYNTNNKILVTQEYEDFTTEKRKYFNKEIDVKIIEANICSTLLTT